MFAYCCADIHTASTNGHEGCLQTFIDRGLNLTIRDNQGQTPLHCASTTGHYRCVQILIANGANVNSLDTIMTMK
jgi:ankyrin repeat protein